MSDTPETDLYYAPRIEDYHHGFKTYEVMRDADFARRLERERDEARIQYRSTLALAEALANTQIELKKERDELRADQINHENLSMRYMDERDKWRQCAGMLADWMRSRASFDLVAVEALNEFERLKEEQ